METKTCLRCKTTKPITEFRPQWKSKDGHMNNCKSCQHKGGRPKKNSLGRDYIKKVSNNKREEISTDNYKNFLLEVQYLQNIGAVINHSDLQVKHNVSKTTTAFIPDLRNKLLTPDIVKTYKNNVISHLKETYPVKTKNEMTWVEEIKAQNIMTIKLLRIICAKLGINY